jgi:hypothetical protein
MYEHSNGFTVASRANLNLPSDLLEWNLDEFNVSLKFSPMYVLHGKHSKY